MQNAFLYLTKQEFYFAEMEVVCGEKGSYKKQKKAI
jgi:hypothetical protein